VQTRPWRYRAYGNLDPRATSQVGWDLRPIIDRNILHVLTATSQVLEGFMGMDDAWLP
jgi:hypothetical protein